MRRFNFLALFVFLAASRSPAALVENVNFSQINMVGGALPAYSHYWQAFDGSDGTSPGNPGVRFRGATCIDGTLPECREQIPMPPLTISDPFTMRITEMVFSCDLVEGCPELEFLYHVDLTFEEAASMFTPKVDWHISGCTLPTPSINGMIPSCTGASAENTLYIAYYFGFEAYDNDGNLLATREFGSPALDQNFLQVSGNFSHGGVGTPLPVVKRYAMLIGGRIGGAPIYGEGGFERLGDWTGAIVFPGSISATIDTTPLSGGEIPEPGDFVLSASGLAALLFYYRSRKTRR